MVGLGGEALIVARQILAEQVAVELRVRRKSRLTCEHLRDALVLVGR